MDRLDEKKLIDAANSLLEDVRENGMPDHWLLAQQHVQDITKNDAEFTLMVNVKPYRGGDSSSSSDTLLQRNLIQAAKNLIESAYSGDPHLYLEAAIQRFTDSAGKRYTLNAVVRPVDVRSMTMT